MGFSQLCIKRADLTHAQDISKLINLTYRGDFGWTRETHIIRGDRTNPHEIASALSNPEGHFFVAYQESRLISCIYVAKEMEQAYIGFFSVHPDFQGEGLGKHMLEYAESFAKTHLKMTRFVMFVVAQRSELIAFYERRGYLHTNRIEPYPEHLGIGIPKVEGLTIEYLEKVISL